MLDQHTSLMLLKKYKLSYPKTLITKPQMQKNIKLNFPLALKVDSKRVIHKTDMGVVFTNVSSLNELNRHIKTIMTIMDMHKIIEYSLVIQEMVKGTELIIGMKRDSTFGPVIIFGLGGIFVETLKDVSMRIAPLTVHDCKELLNIKSAKLLEGARNTKPVNKESVIQILMQASRLAMEQKNITEFDFNPVIANEKTAYVVDARFIDA